MKVKTVWRKFIIKMINLLGGNAYLCDSCMHGYRGCSYHHKEYPNAIKCPDYKERY